MRNGDRTGKGELLMQNITAPSHYLYFTNNMERKCNFKRVRTRSRTHTRVAFQWLQSPSSREAMETLIMKVSITFKLQQSWSISLFINSLNQSWSNCETIVKHHEAIVKQSWSNREAIVNQSWSNHEAIMKQPLFTYKLHQSWRNSYLRDYSNPYIWVYTTHEAIVKQSWSHHGAIMK